MGAAFSALLVMELLVRRGLPERSGKKSDSLCPLEVWTVALFGSLWGLCFETGSCCVCSSDLVNSFVWPPTQDSPLSC